MSSSAGLTTDRPSGFPVLGHRGETVPWALVEPLRDRLFVNHDQTVERLAARGGLSYRELYAALVDADPIRLALVDAARARTAIRAYLAAHPTGPEPHAVDRVALAALYAAVPR